MWSQPEILLYALPPCEDLRCGIGYPDFIETAKGEIFLTETDKKDSRVHRLPPKMLEMMWKQSTLSERVTRGLTLELPNATAARRSLDRGNGSALPATVNAGNRLHELCSAEVQPGPCLGLQYLQYLV